MRGHTPGHETHVSRPGFFDTVLQCDPRSAIICHCYFSASVIPGPILFADTFAFFDLGLPSTSDCTRGVAEGSSLLWEIWHFNCARNVPHNFQAAVPKWTHGKCW